jgi:mRNA interferase MazF
MNVNRGDIVLAYYPFASGAGSSRRPVLVVQSDTQNRRIQNTIVVQITSNLKRVKEPTHLLIEVATPHGAQSGLLHDSLVSCINLATNTKTASTKSSARLPPQPWSTTA